MYTYDEALAASEEYFNNDELSAKVFLDKYALRDNDNNILEKTPTDMFRRVAKELARIEKGKFSKPYTEDEIFGWMEHFNKIIPQGSCLYGIGNKYQYISVSNCFVVKSPSDSIGGINHTEDQIMQISKRRGGVGVDISSLRPNKSQTRNSSRTSSGPISFAAKYSNAIRTIGQNGRRGAGLVAMNIHHPDILEFINCKRDKNAITGVNISVKLTDEFLNAVVNNEEYEQRWPVDSKKPKIKRMVKAKDIWDALVFSAWDSAEPGILFWDTIIEESVPDCYSIFGFISIATNPCGEIILCANDSCRLLLLNLYSFVKNRFLKSAYFDYIEFFDFCQKAQRMMDDIVDLEIESIKEIIKKIESDPEENHIKQNELLLWEDALKKCINGRRTGTGITALGDCLAALNIKYASDESIEFVDNLYKVMKFGCYKSSIDMAKEIGTFPLYDSKFEVDNPYINRLKGENILLDSGSTPIILDGKTLYNKMCRYGRRNIACLTTSPAGTMSVETQTSSGIEPILYLKAKRKKKGNPGDENFRVDFTDRTGDTWMEFEVSHHKIKDWEKATGKTNIEESPWFGCCAEEIDYNKKVELQAAAQKHVDHSISNTINLPSNITKEKVGELYLSGWKLRVKGLTVYRKGSRDGVITENKSDERSKELKCNVHHITVKGQQYFVLVGMSCDKPYEVFAGKNGQIHKKVKAGTIIRKKTGVYKAIFDDGTILESVIEHCTELEVIVTRLTSLSLRSGADIHRVVKQLEKVGEKQSDIHSFSRSVARALKGYIPDGTQDDELCPECQTKTIRQQGCIACPNCQWSKCS